ncbi:hypothetical protein ACXDJA_002593 [Klebsiella variicola]
MTTDITELAQSEINDALAQLKQISEYPTPSTQYARVLRKYIATLVEALEKAQQRIIALQQRHEVDPRTHEIIDLKERIDELEIMLKAAENNEIDARCHIAELEESNAQVIQSRDHYKRMTEEGLKQLAESRTVKLPKPKNSDQGWKIDPEFINKVQDAIGYDDTCECWEGTPSMELVEAVLLAAAGIKVEAE